MGLFSVKVAFWVAKGELEVVGRSTPFGAERSEDGMTDWRAGVVKVSEVVVLRIESKRESWRVKSAFAKAA